MSSKSSITVILNEKIVKILEKRAQKEEQTIEELASDILRRSAVSSKTSSISSDNINDKFIGIFSRKKRTNLKLREKSSSNDLLKPLDLYKKSEKIN